MMVASGMPASVRAMRSASAWLSVAGAGAAASRANEELTCQTAPSRTPIEIRPSTAAGRSPKRCRMMTAAPAPIGATVSTSRAAAPASVSPSTSRLAAMYAFGRRPASAGRPVASGAPAEASTAGVPSAFQRARRPAARSRWRAVGSIRPARLSFTLFFCCSPGAPPGVVRCASAWALPPGSATELPGDVASTSTARGQQCHGPRKRTGSCAHMGPPRSRGRSATMGIHPSMSVCAPMSRLTTVGHSSAALWPTASVIRPGRARGPRPAPAGRVAPGHGPGGARECRRGYEAACQQVERNRPPTGSVAASRL